MADEQAGGGAREAAREVIESRLTKRQVDALFDGALALTKSARGWCPGCKKQVWVEIPDAKAVVGALADIITKIADLPTDRDQGERIVFERVVYMDDPEAVNGSDA